MTKEEGSHTTSRMVQDGSHHTVQKDSPEKVSW